MRRTGHRPVPSRERAPMDKLLEQYGCGPIQFTGSETMRSTSGTSCSTTSSIRRRPARASATRPSPAPCATSCRSDGCARRRRTSAENPKRVYYLSMEFLIGRSLANNITNLLLDPVGPAGRVDEKASTGSACSRRSPTPAWATAASAASRRASSTRWRRCSSRPWATGCGTSTASSGRPSRRLAAGAAGQLAAAARSVGGRPAPGAGGGQARLLVRGARRDARAPSPGSLRACSAFRSIARWWATAARRSTRSGSGRPPRPTSSTSRRSAPATS